MQLMCSTGTNVKPSEINPQGVPTSQRSTMSRLRALQNASVQLQSRLQHETVRIQNDFAGQGLHGNTLCFILVLDLIRKYTKFDFVCSSILI